MQASKRTALPVAAAVLFVVTAACEFASPGQPKWNDPSAGKSRWGTDAVFTPARAGFHLVAFGDDVLPCGPHGPCNCGQEQVVAHRHLVRSDRAEQYSGDEDREVDGFGHRSPPAVAGAWSRRSTMVLAASAWAPGFAEDGGSVNDLGIGGPWLGGEGDLNGRDGSDP